jgi:TRAP transporter TAXI family solute receptor
MRTTQKQSIRRRARLGTWLCAAFTSAVLLAAQQMAAAKPGDKPANLTIASFSQGSSWYVYAVNLAELLRGVLPPGSSIDTPPIAGGLANPQLVTAGKAQLAFGMAVVGNWALQGKIGYKQPMPNLRALVGGLDEYFLVALARGKGFSPDLAGFFKTVRPNARVTLLQRGSIGGFAGQQLLDLAGADEKTLSAHGGGYEFGTFGMVKNRFAAGTGDVFVHVATRGHPTITEIAHDTPVTFLAPSDKILQEMQEKFGWESRVLPKNTFPGQDQDVRLPGTTTVLFASTAMSDDLAYTVVKTICENTAKLRAAHKALAHFDCANGTWKLAETGLPLHPGAARYYKERGWLK